MQNVFDQDLFDQSVWEARGADDDNDYSDSDVMQGRPDIRYPIPHRVSEIAGLRRQADALRGRQARLSEAMRLRGSGAALGAAAGAGGVFHPMEIEDERKGPFDLPILPHFAPLPAVSFFVSFFV